MSVCMCVCVYVCLYVCLSVCMYVCMYVCLYVCLSVYACMHACMYVNGYVCQHVCMHVCACTCMRACVILVDLVVLEMGRGCRCIRCCRPGTDGLLLSILGEVFSLVNLYNPTLPRWDAQPSMGQGEAILSFGDVEQLCTHGCSLKSLATSGKRFHGSYPCNTLVGRTCRLYQAQPFEKGHFAIHGLTVLDSSPK